MEAAGCVHLDDNTGIGNGGGLQRLSLMEIMANKRHHLSDITNSTSHSQRNPRSLPGQENQNIAPLQKAKDYVAELLKENTALLRLLGEKNKCIETNALEMQKLRISLQQLHQQNCQLARTNTLMLEELNLGKDRLKAMQHELGCTVAVLKTTKLELEENRLLVLEVSRKTANLRSEEDMVDRPHGARKAGRSPPKKRASRRCSLGSVLPVREASAKEKSVQLDSHPPLSEEQDHPASKEESNPKRKRASRQCCNNCSMCSCNLSLGSAALAREVSLKENTEIAQKRRSSRTTRHTEACDQKENQFFELSDLSKRSEIVQLDRSISPPTVETSSNTYVDSSEQGQNRRSISGRPQRRSTVGVSYKEKSLIVKMRRP